MEAPVEDPVAQAAKLPLSQRIVHKHWKVRETAIRELADKFKLSPDDSKIYLDFAPSLVKISRDANASAQLAAYEAFAAYADTAPPPLVRKIATDVTKAIIDKGLSGRPANKTKAIDAMIMFCAADAGDIIVDTVVATGFTHRTPKIVVASVECLSRAIDVYGTVAVPPKPIASKLGALLDHSQESVRGAAKGLVIVLHRWVGAAIKVVLKNAKEVIVKEMEKAFAENEKLGKPKPEKLTRAMEQRERRTGARPDIGDADIGFGDVEAEEEEIDLGEEINLLEKLSTVKIEVEEGVKKDWYFAVDSKKWSARKNALESAIEIIGDSRLTPGPHHDVLVRIRKILAKDANVNVVASSAKLLKSMAAGLKKTFPSNSAKLVTIDLLGRLKEKNRIVVEAVCSALDTLHEKRCITVTELIDEVSASANHKVPKARAELFLWLGRCFHKGTPASTLKGPPLKRFGTICLKATDDSSPDVRDASLSCMAALQKLVGERNMAVYVEKLDKKRKDKILALVATLPEPTKTTKPHTKTNRQEGNNVRGPQKYVPIPVKVSTPNSESPEPQKSEERNLSEALHSDDEGQTTGGPQDALVAAGKRFDGFEPENWSAKSFKTRAAAASVIVAALEEKSVFDKDDISVVLGLLHCDPGLSDSNFVAVKSKLELFGMVATKCMSPPPRGTLRPLVVSALEKLGDIKSAKLVADILTSYVEATSPRFFFAILLHVSKETKNSRALIGILKFASSIVEDFGVPDESQEMLAALAGGNINNPAAAAKNAALVLACKAANRVGPEKFRGMLGSKGVDEGGVEAFDTELQKYSRGLDPPSKKKRFDTQKSPLLTAEESLDQGQSEPPLSGIRESPSRPEDRTPTHKAGSDANDVSSNPSHRVSVAQEFAAGSRLFLELKNSNWKKRQEALEYVDRVISEANDRIEPDVGTEILAALRARLSDSNRNLATLAHTVMSRMMKAMGPGGIVHLKALAPSVLGQGCVDIKKSVREAAMHCLHNWFQSFGISPLIPYLHLPLASLNSGVRKEFLEWSVPRLQGEVGEFESSEHDLSPMVDPCLACLRDRTAEVRHLADLALEQVVKSVGLQIVDAKVTSLTKSVRLQLEPVLDKYRAGPSSEQTNEPRTPKPEKHSTPRSSRQRPQSVAFSRTPLNRRTLGGDVSTPTPGNRRPRPASVRTTPVTPSLHAQHTPVRERSPLLKANNGRNARAQRFANRRLYVHEQVFASNSAGPVPLMREELQDLAGDLSECCSTELYAKLMAPANRFRMHVEAIEMVRDQLDQHPDSLVSVADVLLRWAACRIEDSKTPPTVLVKLATFVSNMCEILISSEVKLDEYEASAILPPIVEKSASNRETVRGAMRSALLSVSDIVDDEVLLLLFTSCLREPMSTRSLSEISREICRLLDKRCSIGAGIPPGVLPSIGKTAGGEDDGAGQAAAACLEKAHEYFGDDLWALIGDFSREEASLLDERLTSAMNGVRQRVLGSDKQGDVLSDQRLQPLAKAVEPVDIRNEDFRLSVAPAPPSGVLTSISDSLNMSTPLRTKSEMQAGRIQETPALRNRRFAFQGDPQAEEEAANDILLRLQSPDRDLQLSGLASIFEDLKREAYLLGSSVGAQILRQLVRCFAETLARLEGPAPLEDDPAVLKSFLKGVIRFAREPELLCQLEQDTVELLLSDALDSMLPQTVQGVTDWDQVRRGVNLMIVKILESCDQNLLFTAMINLLLSNIRIMQHSTKKRISALAKSSICIKSIAKVAKRGFQHCRVNALLRDIHLFLVANPVRKDSSPSDDQTLAMRLLKTVVIALIDEFGAAIRTKLDLIPHPEKSQLVQYVEMTLAGRNLEDRHVDDTSNGDIQGRCNMIDSSDEHDSRTVHEMLSAMDIADGSYYPLQKLHAFLMRNPGIDLQHSLERCNPEVREYVETGLDKLRGETDILSDGTVKQGDEDSGCSRQSALVTESNQAPSSSSTAGHVYLKRLHEIQLRYGLQSSPKTTSEASEGHGPHPEVGEKENGNMDKPASGEEARGKASSLRERMARIRELQAAAKE